MSLAGVPVELLHRYGGHGGQPTEWEISAPTRLAGAMLHSLQLPRGAQLLPHEVTSCLVLAEGTSVLLAGEIAARIATLDGGALQAALDRVPQDVEVFERECAARHAGE